MLRESVGIFEIIDEQLFFLSVIKYGIEFVKTSDESER
jgi:hypothetical protein